MHWNTHDKTQVTQHHPGSADNVFVQFRTQQTAVAYDLATRNADAALAALTGKLSILPRLRPTNSAEQKAKFFDARGDYEPIFTYAPLGFDEQVHEKKLRALDFSAVPNRELRALFEEKRAELLLEVELLQSRGSKTFAVISTLLHGRPSSNDLQVARQILALAPEHDERTLSAKQVKQALDAFAKTLRKQSTLPCKVRLLEGRSARAAATSRAVLLASDASFSPADAASLCAHEIGWHVLTSRNGRAQPLHLFRDGVANYLGDQEGGAVFQELLTPHALTVNRLRVLALRSVSVDLALRGATFAQVFANLVQYGTALEEAYNVCERIFRGGVFTKDALYLSHFLFVMREARRGALDIATFAAGKMRLRDIPFVASQIAQGLMRPARVLPPTRGSLAHVPAHMRAALQL